MSPAIRVEGLVKVFRRTDRGARGELRAVDGLGFDVPRGAIFGLLGPNGAGKTTTLRILTTLARPTAGTASVLGFDVVQDPRAVRRQIVVVIQELAADLLLSVRDNLLTFARFHGLTGEDVRRRAERVMDDLGLREEATRKVQDLSGGFRRRVQVAKVFLVDTPVMFLDEFSIGMDPALKRNVMELLRREVARGRTIVLTTQILSEAEELCDDILIMDRGRQVARGDLHALKLLSERAYDVTLTFDRMPDDVEELLAGYRPLRTRINRNTLHVVLNDETRVVALVGALSARARIEHLEITGATLEDVFLELTQKGLAS